MVRHRLSYCRYVTATHRYVSRQDGRTVKIGVGVRFHDKEAQPGRTADRAQDAHTRSLVGIIIDDLCLAPL